MATARLTSGFSADPATADGWISCNPGPATRPNPKSRTMAGRRKRHASHWLATPAPAMHRTAAATPVSIRPLRLGSGLNVSRGGEVRTGDAFPKCCRILRWDDYGAASVRERGCSIKKRSICRVASGPRGSV